MLSDVRSQKIAITEPLRILILEERLAVKKSAAQVAAALDRSQSWIAQIENGRKQKINAMELISLFVELLNCSRAEAMDYLTKHLFDLPEEEKEPEEPLTIQLTDALQSFCDTIFKEFYDSDSTKKEIILTALEELPDTFFDFFVKELPDEIDIQKLTIDEYNHLLMTKPLVGGVYRVPVLKLPAIQKGLNHYDHQEFVLCGVIENYLHKPGKKESIIIPILPALAKDYSKTHYSFRLFGSSYTAIGELCSTIENQALQQLIAFSSLEEFSSMVYVIHRYNGDRILPSAPNEIIKSRQPYFTHIFNHQKLLLRI